MDVRARVRAHLERMATDRVAARTAAAHLKPLPVSDWPATVRAMTALRAPGALSYVLDVAQEKLEQSADEALLLSQLVVDCLPPNTENVVLRGRALKVHAHALRQTGEGRAAQSAIEEAMILLSAFPAGGVQMEYSRLLFAFLAHERGDTYSALRFLKDAADAFTASGNAFGLVQAQMMKASILFEDEQYVRARQIFLDVLAVAERLEDERSCARILANLGQCCERLGLPEEAIAYFAEAVPLAENQQMDEALQKILWGMARIVRLRGQPMEALTALRCVRDALLQRGMLLTAAVVGLDILALAVATSRHDLTLSLATELVAVFRKCEIPAAAIRELMDVEALAFRRQLDNPAINRARERFRMSFAA